MSLLYSVQFISTGDHPVMGLLHHDAITQHSLVRSSLLLTRNICPTYTSVSFHDYILQNGDVTALKKSVHRLTNSLQNNCVCGHSTPLILQPDLHLDLTYTSVQLHDCILHRCDAIVSQTDVQWLNSPFQHLVSRCPCSDHTHLVFLPIF